MSPSPDDERTCQANADDVALARLVQELDRMFPEGSDARLGVSDPLATMVVASFHPEAEVPLGPALDALEDVVEALMRSAGWPARALGGAAR
ncbi:hypothetical protein [Paraliomyxa miuraensis]|uniref:hypothetical protein n=1 Tax=Paraliomyxa miuraensis TaxID=376150 RepID=UPI00224ED394|nr:hypothetical protein [Paraliomyxa miuraensis]MCX4244136.1 hypothetical protein [Paraliomyxa miuraensis]